MFWNPKWGRVTSKTFTEHVIPVIDTKIKIQTKLLFMQDNTPHSAKHMQMKFVCQDTLVMSWPASSPDLNPIQTIWQRIKHRI